MLVHNSSKIYNGQTEIKKVYAGQTVVYEKETGPSYTEVKYLQSSGTQYIDPNLVNYTNGLKAEFKWAPMDATVNYQFIWGAEEDNGEGRDYFKYSNYYTLELGASMYLPFGYTTTVDTAYITEVNTVKNTTQYVNINGIQAYSTTTSNTEDRTALSPFIFAIDRGGYAAEYGRIKLYYLKFYDENNTLLRDFIPVLDEENVACLYDKVSKTFFYNEGSGVFTYSRYTALQYIESAGTQYINTGYTPNVNTKIEIDFQYTTSTVDGKTRVFGCRRTWNEGFYLGTHMNYADTTVGYWYLFSNKYDYSGTSAKFNRNRHTITLDKTAFKIDGSTISSFSAGTFTPYTQACLFGAYDESTTTPTLGILRLYSCKIYENDVLVRDFSPALDDSNVPCLFENVSGTYYYNQGTGTFLYG